MSKNKNKMREEMIEAFLKALKEEVIPWHKSWSAVTARPYNVVSDSVYHGANALYLLIKAEENGYDDPRWCTYKQAKDNGWQVRKGEKGTCVEFWSMYDRKEKKKIGLKEAELLQERLSPEEFKERVRPVSGNYTVFNAAQIDGVPELAIETYVLKEEELAEKRELLLKNMNVQFKEGGEKAFYRPAEDCIYLPEPKRFESEYAYMATLLHEAGHATGHESRMNRKIKNVFGTPDYAKEELRAEIASAFIAQMIHFAQDETQMQNHKAYIQNWIEILEKEPQELFQAIRDAEKISDYLIEKGGFQLERSKGKSAPGRNEDVDILGYYTSGTDTQYIHYDISNSETRRAKEYLTDGENLYFGDDVARLLPRLNETAHLPDRDRMLEDLQEWQPHTALTDYMQRIAGEITFETDRGIVEVMTYTDEQEYLKAVADELEFSAGRGCTFETFSNNSDVRKGIDDIVYDFYGEDNPNDIDYYRKKYNPEKASESEEKSFSEQIDDLLNGKANRYNDLKVCDTPQILIDAGCELLPMLYTQAHLRKAILPKNTKKHNHGLSVEQIKRLPEYMSEPVMLIDSVTRADSIIAVFSAVDNENSPLVATVKPNGKGMYNLELQDSNFITSIYGRDNFARFLDVSMKNDKILYVNEEKSQELFSVLGLQFPKGFNNLDYNIIIHKSNNIVKKISENNEVYDAEEGKLIDGVAQMEETLHISSEERITEWFGDYVINVAKSGVTKEDLLRKKDELQALYAEPTVTIIWSEHSRFHENETMSLYEANALMESLDKVTASEDRYYKTEFCIDFVMNGKSEEYTGRQDLGDGDGSLIDHIEKYHADLENDEQLEDYVLRSWGAEALEKNKAQRSMLLNEFVPYLKIHNTLSQMEQTTARGLEENDDVRTIETAYCVAMQEHISQCRAMINNGNFNLPSPPQLKEFDTELIDYKKHVEEEIAQEAAASGMTVEEYAKNGYEPYVEKEKVEHEGSQKNHRLNVGRKRR